MDWIKEQLNKARWEIGENPGVRVIDGRIYGSVFAFLNGEEPPQLHSLDLAEAPDPIDKALIKERRERIGRLKEASWGMFGRYTPLIETEIICLPYLEGLLVLHRRTISGQNNYLDMLKPQKERSRISYRGMIRER